MKTATLIGVLAIALLAVAAPAATADPGSDGGDSSGGSCISYTPQQNPPVVVDPDACVIHDGT